MPRYNNVMEVLTLTTVELKSDDTKNDPNDKWKESQVDFLSGTKTVSTHGV